jgi:hypothetical protein
MKKNVIIILFFFAVISAGYVSIGHGHNNSAPNFECINCHEGDIVPGMVKITGLPKSFVPGKRYDLTIVITSDHQSLGDVAGGFAVEVTSGELVVKDRKNTQLSDKILTHTQQGSSLRKWSFIWKAPGRKGEAGMSVMAIAANGDYSSAGDKVGSNSYSLVSAK